MAYFGGYISPAANFTGTVTSGVIASGSIARFQLASGAVNSGQVGSGAIIGQAGGGAFNIGSGTIGTFDIGSGAVNSGLVASGVIGVYHLSSGLVTSGLYLSGSLGSGQIGTYHFASGNSANCSVARATAAISSGLTTTAVLTQELISGVKCVGVSQSGNIWIAMASVSGRMPAVGVVVDNVASGLQATVYSEGIISFTSGLFTAIGFFGQPVWVGRSGHLCPMSGSFCSGGWASGDIGQKMGVALAFGSGGVLLNTSDVVWSGGPLGEATGGVI